MHRDPVYHFCQQQLESTLELLRRMVEINSFTSNAAGINRLGEVTAESFAPLGFESTTVQSAYEGYGKHLVLRRRAAEDAPTIALISHLDTVFPPEEEERNQFLWRPAGDRIYGPGTNDIKGGTAMIHLVLSALKAELPEVFEAVNWAVILNACEETISAEFRQVCLDHLPADTRGCLIFEADGGDAPDYTLVAARKGRATFAVDVEGRGAHAGSSHQQGANAVVQLADVIQRLAAITDYEAKVTVNVGSCIGGTVINRVPHSARAELEMRAFGSTEFERARAAILGCAGEGSVRSADGAAHPCRVRVSQLEETGPWPQNDRTDALITLWQESAGSLGVQIGAQHRGGLSDGNVLWDLWPTMDGLGPRGDNCHCSEQSEDGSKQQEWVDVASFVPKAVLNVHAIARLARGEPA